VETTGANPYNSVHAVKVFINEVRKTIQFNIYKRRQTTIIKIS